MSGEALTFARSIFTSLNTSSINALDESDFEETAEDAFEEGAADDFALETFLEDAAVELAFLEDVIFEEAVEGDSFGDSCNDDGEVTDSDTADGSPLELENSEDVKSDEVDEELTYDEPEPCPACDVPDELSGFMRQPAVKSMITNEIEIHIVFFIKYPSVSFLFFIIPDYLNNNHL